MYKSGANTVYVNTWTPYMGANKIYSVNGDWYIDLTGKAYLHGVDINGNDFLTQHKDNPKKSSDPDNLKTRTIKITDAIAEAGFSTGNINLNNLTFTPQTITETQTANIQFTEDSDTAFVVGKTVQGILEIKANNGQSITKNISMTAAGVYQAGVNDARANHITWTPIDPTTYSNIIAKRYGNVQTYGNSNNKYIQVQFELTADHLNSDNESTYPYTIPNNYIGPATFNVDVTDLVNSSGTISVSELDIISATNYNASSSTNTEITGSNSISENSNGTVTAIGAIKVNNKSYYSNVPLDITGIVEDLYLRRKNSISVRDYNSTTHRLYLTSHYEVRLDNGSTSTLILDVYDKGDDNSVDISNYISSSSGIDIDNISFSDLTGVSYLNPASESLSPVYVGTANTQYLTASGNKSARVQGGVTITLSDGSNTRQKTIIVEMSTDEIPIDYTVLGVNPNNSYSYMQIDDNVWTSNDNKYLRGIVEITCGASKKQYDVRMTIPSNISSGSSSGTSSYSIAPTTDLNYWNDAYRRFDVTVNNSDAGYVQFYKSNNTVRFAYEDIQNNVLGDDLWFDYSSGSSSGQSSRTGTVEWTTANGSILTGEDYKLNAYSASFTKNGYYSTIYCKIHYSDDTYSDVQELNVNTYNAYQEGFTAGSGDQLIDEPSYTITNGNVAGGTYSDSDPYILPVTATFEVDGKSRSFPSQVNVYDVYQAGQQSASGSSGSYTGSYYTLIGTSENVLVNYSKVVDDLYYRYGNTYYKFDYTVYFGTPTVRYDAGDTLYLYSKN